MAVIGDAYIAVHPETKGFASEAESGLGNSLRVVGGLIAGAFAVDAIKGFITAAAESNKISAQTAAVLKSTGDAAHIGAAGVDRLADSIAAKTGIDDEAIQSGENLLLTFTNIRNETGKGNDIFNQATSAITDMSVAMGQDMKSSAIQVGKALNDPIKGVTALQRVGVTFSQSQKDTIETLVKTGHTLEAQKMILAELNKEFGGSAEAVATPMAKLKVQLDNVAETLGNLLIPYLSKLADFLARNLPGAIAFVQRAFEQMRPALEVVGRAIQVVGSAISDFAKSNPHVAFAVAATAVGLLAVALIALEAPAIAAAAPFIAIAAAVAAAAGGFVYAYEHFETFRKVVDAVVSGTVAAAERLITTWQRVWQTLTADFSLFTTGFTQSHLPVAIDSIQGAIVVFGQKTREVMDFVITQFQHLSAFVAKIWPDISEAIRHTMNAIRDVVGVVLVSVLFVWNHFGKEIMQIVRAVFGFVEAYIKTVVRVIRDIIVAVLALINGDWRKAWHAIADIPAAMFRLMITAITTSLRILGSVMEAAFKGIWLLVNKAWQLLWASLKDAFDAAWEWLKSLPEKLLQLGKDVITGLAYGMGFALGLVFDFVVKLPIKLVEWIGDAAVWLFEKGKDVITGLWHGMINITDALIGWFAGLPGSFVRWMGDLGHLFGAGVQLLRRLWDGMITITDSLIGWFAGLPGSFVGWMGDFAGTFYDVGKRIIDGLVRGIKDFAGNAIGAAKDVAKSIAKGFMDAIHIGSPSRMFHGFGVNIMEGLANGITAGAPLALTALGRVTNDLGVKPAIASVGGFSTAGAGGARFVQEVNVKVEAPGATAETVTALRKVARDEIAGALTGVVRKTTAGTGVS